VIAGELCSYPTGIQSLFPDDHLLVTWRAEGYLGTPLRDGGGNVLGHIAVLDDRPLTPTPEQIEFLKALAARAGTELERTRAIRHVERLNQELSVLLDINRAIGRRLSRDELFGALARCLRRVVPTERFGIELPIEDGAKLQGHILSRMADGAEATQPTVLPSQGTACQWVIEHREWYVASSSEEYRERFPVTFEVMSGDRLESLLALPLISADQCLGALFFMSSARGAYDNLSRSLVEQVASAVAVALDDCLAHEEVRRLRDRLAAETVYLQEEIKTEHNFEAIIGTSPAIKRVFEAIARVAPTDATVLLTGETGTGKELVARAIHHLSQRRDRVMVKVNCAAIPAGLVESELFGHEKGAFTGALARKIGRFELADGATIFLDEVGEIPLDLQTKLLRVLQEGEFERLGSTRTFKVNVRVMAATNRDLERETREGRFRSDLYYRLKVFPIAVPPLRERPEDIPLLVAHFLRKYSAVLGKKVVSVPTRALERLQQYAWPGNIRELEHMIERAVILSEGSELRLDDWMAASPGARQDDGDGTLEMVEREHILRVLEQTGWRVSGERGAAKKLGLKPTTLEARMKKLGIYRPG
jgi:formate hydrogenlyase transcriptional activator